MADQADIRKAHCSRCLGTTSHHLINEYEEKDSEVLAEDEFGQHTIESLERYEMLKCCGCGRLNVRFTQWCSEWNSEPEIRYYPPARSRRMPAWVQGGSWPDDFYFWHDHFVPLMLNEIYTALFDSCPVLATIGIRSLLEQVMIDTTGDKGSFKKNLATFEQDGHVGSKQREILETVLELGHVTTHRSYRPSTKEVTEALDITEVILESVYRHGKLADALRKKVPPREK